MTAATQRAVQEYIRTRLLHIALKKTAGPGRQRQESARRALKLMGTNPSRLVKVRLARTVKGSLWAEWTVTATAVVAADPLLAGFVGSIAANAVTAMPSAFVRAASKLVRSRAADAMVRAPKSKAEAKATSEMVQVAAILAKAGRGRAVYRSESTNSRGECTVSELRIDIDGPMDGRGRKGA